MAATVKAGAKPRPNGTKPQAPEPLRFSSDAEPEPEERETFFIIDDTEYTILKNPGPGIASDAMDILAAGTPSSLVASEKYVMEAMIGEDGWAALRKLARDRRISGKQFRAFVQECTVKAMGALEDEGPNL